MEQKVLFCPKASPFHTGGLMAAILRRSSTRLKLRGTQYWALRPWCL